MYVSGLFLLLLAGLRRPIPGPVVSQQIPRFSFSKTLAQAGTMHHTTCSQQRTDGDGKRKRRRWRNLFGRVSECAKGSGCVEVAYGIT